MKKIILLWLGILPLTWIFLSGERTDMQTDNAVKESGFIKSIEVITTCSVCDSVSVIDSLALVALYDSTNGASWINPWYLNMPICTWYGIGLNVNCRVTEIDLFDNHLDGTLPIELGDLDSLTHLTIGQMFNGGILSGGIPNELGRLTNLVALDLTNNYYIGGPFPDSLCNLTDLETLSLSGSYVTGAIPPCLGDLISLIYLDLSHSDFSNTTIPSSIGNLENLETLSLKNCSLISPIPDSLGNLTFLKSLSISSNSFNEPIPSWIYNLMSLETLNLRGGQFTGPISDDIENLENLRVLLMEGNTLLGGPIPATLGSLNFLHDLRLSHCGLIGPIPNELGNLHNLYTLWLNNNEFYSEVPPSFGGLTGLGELNIRQGHLTGPIPDSLGNLVSLQKMILDGNHLSGVIPSELGNLFTLSELKLGSNDLTGAIPQELGRLENLRFLGLNFNDLTDTIPDSLGQLISLQVLHLDSNTLEGKIPPSLGGLSALIDLNLSYNQLTGAIPDSLGSLNSLDALRLSYNNLADTIPAKLGELNSLRTLTLGHNSLTGNIPPDLGDLGSLLYLGLGFNALEGSIPAELENLQNIEHIRLFNNNLSGCIPSELIDHCNITGFFLDNNPKLPWNGDVDPFCMGEQQIGAPCDDCNPQTENDTITTDCTCAGECFIQIFTNIDTTLCFNESISIGNATYDAAGIFSELLNTSFGCDSIVNLNLDYYAEAIENFDTTLCIGDFLEINGTIYDEDNPRDTVILFGEAIGGCDSTIHINLSFVTGATTGFAYAGEDEAYCDESEASLSESLPNMTFGLWTTVNTNANIENPDQPDTDVSNLSEGENIFAWTLSTTQCADYHSDTVVVTFYSGLPFTLDDDFIEDINVPVTGNILSNDDLEEVVNFEIIFPVKIIEEETTLPYELDSLNFDTDSTFIFNPGVDLCGDFVFEYIVQNADCPELRDTARVYIKITPANDMSIAAPNVITPNGDKYNEFFIIPKLYENPRGFPNNRLMIFNQWGSLVYEAQSYQNDWNGVNQNGEPLPQATYYYYFDDGNGEPISGKVMILK